MSSTTANIGLDETGRNSSNVMKPPGGDCHDLFGADFHGTPSHHRVLKPPGGGTSDIFTSPVDETDKRISPSSLNHEGSPTTNGIERHGNELETIQPDSHVLKQESGDGPVDERAETKKQDAKPASSMARNCVTGEGCQVQEHYAIRVVPQREGNPVTGEGYDDPKTQQSVPTQSRTRIPPGGYSSGLW